MWKETREREFGKLRPNLFTSRISKFRISSIQLSNYKEIVSSHRGSVNSLQVDLTEGRYLLAGASDATVAVYDVQRATDYGGGGLIGKHKSVLLINKQHEHGHKYAISSAIWYPIDTGLFVTGSYDHHINVWDTNTTQVVMNFKMPGKVYRNAMSSIARSHMLIAAGTEDVQVRLCDIASGAFAHTLSGHRDGVMSLEWSTSSEWVLVSGGCDGAIRFWDIRRAGCFRVLDQSHSQFGRRPPLLVRPTTNKKSSSAGQSSSSKVRAPQRKLTNGNAIKAHGVGRVSSQVKSAKQRSHPGMLSSHDRATGHYGVVTGLKVTEDGMYLLSAGSDSRLRLWDIESGCNTLVNFETTRLQSSKAIQMAVSQNSTVAFVPCMTTVKAFDIWSGRTKWNFRGHYENVNCCWYNPLDQVHLSSSLLSLRLLRISVCMVLRTVSLIMPLDNVASPQAKMVHYVTFLISAWHASHIIRAITRGSGFINSQGVEGLSYDPPGLSFLMGIIDRKGIFLLQVPGNLSRFSMQFQMTLS